MSRYDYKSVEPKWQKYWDEHNTFKASDDYSKKKFYGLVEFPYPSGHGMHVGHIKAYSGLEVVSRKRRMEATMSSSRSDLTHTDSLPRIRLSRRIFTRGS